MHFVLLHCHVCASRTEGKPIKKSHTLARCASLFVQTHTHAARPADAPATCASQLRTSHLIRAIQRTTFPARRPTITPWRPRRAEPPAACPDSSQAPRGGGGRWAQPPLHPPAMRARHAGPTGRLRRSRPTGHQERHCGLREHGIDGHRTFKSRVRRPRPLVFTGAPPPPPAAAAPRGGTRRRKPPDATPRRGGAARS